MGTLRSSGYSPNVGVGKMELSLSPRNDIDDGEGRKEGIVSSPLPPLGSSSLF